MKNSFILSVMVLLLGFTSCSSLRTQVDYDTSANFSTYKTFSFYEKGFEEVKLNTLDKKRIKDAIQLELETKGMQMATENTADIVINLNASSKDMVNVNYNNWGLGWGWGWGGMGWGGYWNSGPYISQYKEGTIILDFVDRSRNILIWQGMVEGINVSQIEKKSKILPKAIHRVLEKFPPTVQ